MHWAIGYLSKMGAVRTLADNGVAETDGSYRAHSQAACALDRPEGRLLRRRRRSSWPPACLHQHRQARDLALRLLRRAIRMSSSNPRYWSATNNVQANTHNRKYLESLPSTPYPLDPPSDPATLPASDFHSVDAKTGSTEPLQSNTGRPLEQR